MNIEITDNKSVKEVQEEFQKEFPFLKIEFYKNSQKNGNHALKSQTISGKMTIGIVRHVHSTGPLNIDGHRRVEEIEKDLQTKFGLSAQIFRKSGNMWIETTLTDHWTLLRQNMEGMQMS